MFFFFGCRVLLLPYSISLFSEPDSITSLLSLPLSFNIKECNLYVKNHVKTNLYETRVNVEEAQVKNLNFPLFSEGVKK